MDKKEIEEKKKLKDISSLDLSDVMVSDVSNMFCQLGKNQREYKLTAVSVVLIIVAVLMAFVNIVTNLQTTSYSAEFGQWVWQNGLIIILIFGGFGLHIILVNKKIKWTSNAGEVIASNGLGVLIAVASMFASKIVTKLFISVAPILYLFFFIATAIAEEVFFRFGIQSSIRMVLEKSTKLENSAVRNLINMIVPVLLTSLIFMGFHYFVYLDQPEALITIFIYGLILGTFYEATQTLDTALMGHLVINLIQGIIFINTNLGGF